MPSETVIKLGTVATTVNPTDVQEFRVPAYAFHGGSQPSLICQGLTTAETVTLLKGDGSGYQLVYDMNGAQAKLDAAGTLLVITIASPGIYGILHSTLAAIRDLKLEY